MESFSSIEQAQAAAFLLQKKKPAIPEGAIEIIIEGILIHGGKDNYIEGNLFADYHAAISQTAWRQRPELCC